MTVTELFNILQSLPDAFNDAEVWVTTPDGIRTSRCVITVPNAGDDPLSPRVEIRAAIVYPAELRTDDEK